LLKCKCEDHVPDRKARGFKIAVKE